MRQIRFTKHSGSYEAWCNSTVECPWNGCSVCRDYRCTEYSVQNRCCYLRNKINKFYTTGRSWPRSRNCCFYIWLRSSRKMTGPDHNRLTHPHPHALLHSFFSSNPFSLFFARMASPTLLIVPPTAEPQSYSDPSSSTLGTVHTHQTSNEATAEIVFSLSGDG